MIEIDGSAGEGGGQILRTALSLSCLFNRPFRIFNIRKGRRNPGLMPQHLAGVRALKLLSDAEVSGDQKGSTELTFSPGRLRAEDFSFVIGTAGSTMLLLQTVVPALIRAGRKTRIELRGGTHVPFSPPFHYVSEIFVPVLARMGIAMDLHLASYGFYPKGGGMVRAVISPARELRPLQMPGRGRIVDIRGFSCAASLPLSVAERQRSAAVKKICASLPDSGCPVEVEAAAAEASGAGTFIFLKAESANAAAGFSALGERGKPAEIVGEEAARDLIDYYRSGQALDAYLPDQIVLYLSMCRGESAFTTSRITNHLLTNLRVINLFNPFQWTVEGEEGGPGKVIIRGRGDS